MKLRLEDKGTPAERIAVIPNWVDTARDHAAAAGQRVGPRARAGGRIRRHALGEHRPCPGPRQPRPRRHLPPRPRAAPDRDRGLRRAARRADRARAASRGDRHGSLPSLPAARGARAVALGCGSPLRRPGPRLGRVRRPEPSLRHPRGGAAGAGRGGRGIRDRAHRARRPGAASWCRRGVRSSSRARSATRSPASTRSPRWERGGASTSSARRIARSPSTATGCVVADAVSEQGAVEAVDVVDEPARRSSARAHARARPRPGAAAASGSAASSASRSAIACVSPGRTRYPETPSSTTSSTPPTRVATTGRPAASASISTTGVPSLADVSTFASQAAYQRATSSW